MDEVRSDSGEVKIESGLNGGIGSGVPKIETWKKEELEKVGGGRGEGGRGMFDDYEEDEDDY